MEQWLEKIAEDAFENELEKISMKGVSRISGAASKVMKAVRDAGAEPYTAAITKARGASGKRSAGVILANARKGGIPRKALKGRSIMDYSTSLKKGD